MNEDDKILAGKIGLVLSVVLWWLCSWRLTFHWWEWICVGSNNRHRDTRRLSDPRIQLSDEANLRWQQLLPCTSRWITRRRTFHGLLWLATLCDIVSYADLSQILPFTSDRALAENLGYILLNVVGRSILELLAYCTVTAIWLRKTVDASPRSIDSRATSQRVWLGTLSRVFVLFTMLLVVASVSLSVVVFCRYPHANRESILPTPLSLLQTLLESFCWGTHAFIVGLCIAMTSTLIFSMVPSSEWRRRLTLLAKTVLPMALACVMYLVRCGWLVVAYFSKTAQLRETWVWWITFQWGPTIVTSVALLYSVRKRDSLATETSFAPGDGEHVILQDISHTDSDDNLHRPLLLRPQPPEEAFRAFSMFRHWNDDETLDDSFTIGSPMPHPVVLKPLDANSERDLETSEDMGGNVA